MDLTTKVYRCIGVGNDLESHKQEIETISPARRESAIHQFREKFQIRGTLPGMHEVNSIFYAKSNKIETSL